ncbi:MAG: hypothetical protein ACOC0W_00120 [Desulfosalsimonas sp.]
MSRQQNPEKKRPLWIWLISIFYFGFGISGVMAVAMALIIKAQGPGPAGEVQSLGPLLHSSLWGLLPAANMAGAAALFMMKKAAFYIFSCLLAAKAVMQLLFETPLSGALSEGNTEMILGYGLGYIILAAVCIYTWRLKNSGLLG